MQTEATILELRARLAEAKTRGDNFCSMNRELKQDLTERANYIKSLESDEKKMEKQLELADEKNQRLWAELSEVKLALRGKEQQVDHLNSEIRSLTTNLTLLKDSKEEQDVDISMLKTALDQYKMKMEQKESTISDLNLKNQTLIKQLKAKTQRFRETLENDNRIEQLKEKLESYLLQRNQLSQNLWYCEDCYSTQRKLKELDGIRRDYNQIQEENRELNERLERRAEENKHLECKMRSVEEEYEKKIRMHQNESELESRKKTLDILCHNGLTNSNPVSQKRPGEFAERPSQPSQTSDNSCHPSRADTNSCRCRHETTPATTSQSGSPVFRTVTSVADIHSEPGTSDNSHSKKPRLVKPKENVTKKSAEDVASAFRTPNRFRKLRKLRSDQVSTPSVPTRVTTRSAVKNNVNAADRINSIEKENNENDKKDSATGHRNDMSYDDSVVIPNFKGEKTIISERLDVLEQIESPRNSAEIVANTNKTDSEPIVICDDSVAENEGGRSHHSEDESLSDDDPNWSFLKPLPQYDSKNQTAKSTHFTTKTRAMQTEATIFELRARLAEAKTRGDNFCLRNRELKQELAERANYIKSLESDEKKMEKQLELADEKNQRLWAELSEVKLALRGKEQQVDHLNSEIRSLTTNLTLLKDSKEEQDVDISMLKTALDQYKMKMEQKESTISDLNLKNQTLINQLKAKTQRFRETLENDNRIEQLKEKLESYLLQRNQLSQNLWYCEDCYSTQRKLEELERIRRDYNQIQEENRELNERLERRAEENKHLECKMRSVEEDYAKKIGLEIAKKAHDFLHLQGLTNLTPVSRKRPREFAERSTDSNIPVQDLGKDQPSQKGDNSCHRCRADTNSCRCCHATTSATSATTSQSGSPVFQTVTSVADIHPEPDTSDNSPSKKPRLDKKKKSEKKKSAEGVRKFRQLRSDQVSTPSVPTRVTTRSAVKNDVNAADRINSIEKENSENDEKDSATGHRNDKSYDDSVVIPNSKQKQIPANTKTDSESIVICDDSVNHSEDESLSDDDPTGSFLKPLPQYGSRNQTSKPE